MWVFKYACGEYSTVSDGTDLQNNHVSAFGMSVPRPRA